MKQLFFDTETTGVPKNYKADMSDLDNWPRVIQLAWAIFEDGELLEKRVDLIKPDGWEVPKLDFWVKNGFSTERSMELGVPICDALQAFIEKVNVADVLVAHNMNFDYNILGAEMLRAKMSAAKVIKKECTLQSTIQFCALPGKFGFKYPKLEELHNKLFGVGFVGAHDALNDVMACAACYFELKNRRIM